MKHVKLFEQFLNEAKQYKLGDKYSSDFDYDGMFNDACKDALDESVNEAKNSFKFNLLKKSKQFKYFCYFKINCFFPEKKQIDVNVNNIFDAKRSNYGKYCNKNKDDAFGYLGSRPTTPF